MRDQTEKNSQKENVSGVKVWLGDDGIVRIETGKEMGEGVIEEIVRKFQEIGAGLSEKPKVLVNITHVPHFASSQFRKKVVDLLREALKKPGIKKAAIYGGGPVQKVVVSFVLSVVRVKNIKYFKTEIEALNWLKKDKN